MSFYNHVPPIFVGPFETRVESRAWWLELMGVNPTFLWRGGHYNEDDWDDYIALGFRYGEHRGVLSWGGYEDGTPLYSPSEFLELINTSNSRE